MKAYVYIFFGFPLPLAAPMIVQLLKKHSQSELVWCFGLLKGDPRVQKIPLPKDFTYAHI